MPSKFPWFSASIPEFYRWKRKAVLPVMVFVDVVVQVVVVADAVVVEMVYRLPRHQIFF